MAIHEERPKRQLTRRQFLKTAALGVAAMGLSACTVTMGQEQSIGASALGKQAAQGRSVTINLYNVFGGNDNLHWIELGKRYEQAQSKIGLEITYAPSQGSSGDNPKLLTAIAGGNPPDMAQTVPANTSQLAELGVVTDLKPFVEKQGLTQDDFFPVIWHDMNYKGQVLQMQWDADPNFPFFWDKNLFEKNGLDPNKPPKTIDEVDEYSQKINKTKGGNVVQIGMIPWNQYGMSNSIYTWGWAFGGDFLSEDETEVTPDNEYIVKALEWMAKYAKNVGGADKVTVTPPNLSLHYFGSGNVAMSTLVVPNYRDILDAKVGFKIGTGQIPYEPPGAKKLGAGAWIGGWALFMPTGAKHPEAAWDFMNWVTATPEGTQAQWDTVGFPPGYKKTPVLEKMKQDPIMGPYYDVLVTSTHSRPSIEVGAFLSAQLDEYGGEAVYGRISPLQAMRTVKQNTMTEWNRARRERGEATS